LPGESVQGHYILFVKRSKSGLDVNSGSFEDSSLLDMTLCKPLKLIDVSEKRTASIVNVEDKLSK
jgi:hypothetical protein